MAVLLGTDVPELADLLDGEFLGTQANQQQGDKALLVTTRAKAKQQQEAEVLQQQRELESGVRPNTLDEYKDGEVVSVDEESVKGTVVDLDGEEEGSWMDQFDEELFQPGREKTKLSRREKRQNRLKYNPKEMPLGQGSTTTPHALDISAEELKVLQSTDPTLDTVRKAASGHPSTAGVGFFERDGLVYRRWKRPGRNLEDSGVDQLVLPLQCRGVVLKMAHDIPLAGHLGKEKTAQRILQRFYWPTLYHDVAEYCRGCAVCQKSSHHRVRHAPLVPLPVIDEPFRRIAMDIIGPLPRSRSGKRYVLVVCDYATRYPEAVPLKSIDAAHIAEELVNLFSRVGVPEEILTDQGSNFTSQLLTEMYRMLHIHPIRTTPYHPQTDGLVERFNQTLKSMLRKAAVDEGKDWDKLIPYLLFAYREVPQSSTGFAPFELLYGRSVRGPLDVLRDTWEAGKRSEESVVSYVLSVREKLDKMSELVRDNLEAAQKLQKRWYDQNARESLKKGSKCWFFCRPPQTSWLHNGKGLTMC